MTARSLLAFATFFPAVLYMRRVLRGCRTLIDVGCAEDSTLQILNFKGHTVGVDAWAPAVEAARARGIHDEYHNADIRDVRLERADAVLCIETIEHLEKTESCQLVAELEHLASRVVVITTPNGFVAQEPTDGNPYQRHLCGWEPQEMRDRGYRVFGVLGLKRLRGEFGRIVKKPRLLWWLISKLSEFYVWGRPETAFGMLCVKRQEE